MEYYAHSKNETGEWHLLRDHLIGTAELCSTFAAQIGASEIGFVAGILHDIGKTSDGFQEYIRDDGRKRGPDHSSAGAVLAINCLEALCFPIAGHHAGMSNVNNLAQRLKDKSTDRQIQGQVTRAIAEFGDLLPKGRLDSLLDPHFIGAPKSFEFFVRMIFSCLVDADYLDTESHFYTKRSRDRGIRTSITSLRKQFLTKYRQLQDHADDTYVNAIRREIYKEALAVSTSGPGIFRLTVPTGGGKTLCSLAFALEHAYANGMNRIVVALPYTSIVDQTASTYRDFLGEDNVLEHHSAVQWESDDEDSKNTLRLACENWDAPIVVTTTVQLFESLFSNRPSQTRKIHNLANSVIILDEVQTLPVGLLSPILDVLQELVDRYGVSIILCTATQPALEDSPFMEGLRNVTDIIPDPERYFEQLKRVRYRIPMLDGAWTWSELADNVRRNHQALVVLNTKADALKLLDLLGEEEALHLSTLLCPWHRQLVLAEVKDRLKQGDRCILVSTQVIEAGVDLDFPIVYRALGPLDRIVQAAGRCNREGRLQDKSGQKIPGDVIIFEPADGGLPKGDYVTGTHIARNLLLVEGLDLHRPEVFDRYFSLFYQSIDLDAKGVQAIRKERLNYEEVASRFVMIDSPTTSVVINPPWAEIPVSRLLEEVVRNGVNRKAMRQLQKYSVSVYTNKLQRLLIEGKAEEVVPGIFVWLGWYDRIRGLMEKDYPADALVM